MRPQQRQRLATLAEAVKAESEYATKVQVRRSLEQQHWKSGHTCGSAAESNLSVR